jgi:cyclic beta-1,2-glucan synthetase
MPNPKTGLQQNQTTPLDQLRGREDATDPFKQAAHSLARQHHQVAFTAVSPSLLQRLSWHIELLEAVYQYFVHTSQETHDYSVAAEWILDNYYVIRQTPRQVKQDLPPDYYKQLPKLDNGSSCHGLPRIYALAQECTLLENCQIDIEWVENFLLTYQEITPLTMGEVWALPTMLRYCLMDCLAQAAGRITGQLSDHPQLESTLNLSEIERSESEIIANSILSLRLLGSHDWQTFFEDVSQVEQILRQDPAQLYSRMTFNTRDQYRKIIE